MVILCDLGGVLVDLHWKQHASKLFGAELDADRLKQKWLQLKSIKDFEAGEVDFATFHRSFIGETGATIGLKEFEREFLGIIGPLKNHCLSTLKELKKLGTLAMLSNTNAMHVKLLKGRGNLFEFFEHLFFSHEMGMVKPDRQIYATVCANLRQPPENVFFFDDSAVNVEAAKQTGINAHLVNEPPQILAILHKNMAA